MSYDPYAPPPPGWGGPPLPPRSPGRTAAIVAGCIALALAVPTVIVATVYLAGDVARRTAPPRPVTSGEYVPLGHQKVLYDESGPGFLIRGPEFWRITKRTNDDLLDYRRIGFDGPDERIAITTYPGDTSTSVEDALAHTVETVGARAGLVAAGVPRARPVAGHDALLQRLVDRGGGTREYWLCVFRYAGARWVALYTGPLRDVREEPGELAAVLSTWRW